MTNVQKQTKSTALALMADRVAVSPAELERTLMDTAFKGSSAAEFLTLVAVANQYNLNPLVREIYAFPKKGGGIVPLVPIDGWLKLIRTNPDFAGMDIAWADEMVQVAPAAKECPTWVEVTIHHLSHPEHPTVHREWIDEMYRPTGPWNDTTKRMLEWKGISQAGRIAFGLTGIVDSDEAERISQGEVIEGTATEETVVQPLGKAAWKKLVKAADMYGYTESDVIASAATAGYEGPAESMPEDLAQRIYQGMKANPNLAPAPETPAADPETGEIIDAEPVEEQKGYRTPMLGNDV